MKPTKYKFIFRVHALRRMFERCISRQELISALDNGEVIAEYPDDMPYPSRLILGLAGKRALHMVVAENEADSELIVITVYEPDPAKWSSDLKTRTDK